MIFISIEGGEYVGKSSICIPALSEIIKLNGTPLLVVREPGGTETGERLRKIIFEKAKNGAPQKELAELFYQARHALISEKLIPFQQQFPDGIVLSDRFLDSTRVYQSLEGGLSLDNIKQLEQKYLEGFYPDITFILYINPKIFTQIFRKRQLKRNNGSYEVTHWDNASIEKHRKRQEMYLALPEIARKMGEKRLFYTIDTTKPIDEYVQDCMNRINEYKNK